MSIINLHSDGPIGNLSSEEWLSAYGNIADGTQPVGPIFKELLEQLKQLNRFVVQQEENSDERQQQAVFEYLKAHPVSMTAVEIAKRVMERAE